MNQNTFVNEQLWNFLMAILNLLYNFSFIILAGIIIYLGIIYITAGKEEVIKKVHERWLFLLLGVVLLFFSITLPNLVKMFFGLNP